MQKLSEETKNTLLEALLRDEKENPFIEDDGLIYMQFDSISFQNSGEDLQASFIYAGKKLYYQTIRKAKLCSNAELTLSGIEGRVQVSLRTTKADV